MTHAKQAPVTPVSPEAIEGANATPESTEGLPGRSQNKQQRKSGVTNEPDGLKRVELRATEEFVSALEALAKKENSSKADIIRKGAGLYARMRMEQERGNLLGVIALENGELKVKELIQL
jgi:hypothetical protein